MRLTFPCKTNHGTNTGESLTATQENTVSFGAHCDLTQKRHMLEKELNASGGVNAGDQGPAMRLKWRSATG